MISFSRPSRSGSPRTAVISLLASLSLLAMCLPPAAASPAGDRLLAQIASHAPQGKQRVVVDVYDTKTRQMRQLAGYVPQAATAQPEATMAGPQLMPPSPKLMRDPVKAQRVRAILKRQAHQAGLNAPGWGPSRADRLQPRAFGGKAITGTWHALVLLVDFSDNTPTLYPGAAGPTHFNSLLFDSPAYTNSVQDYYKEVSCGAFTLTGAAVGGSANWYRAPQTYAYYVNGAEGTGTYPQNSQKMVEDVCALADPDVDFSQYANDGSAYINALFVVHAGMGQEESGDPADMWSHKWQTVNHPLLDGKVLNTYSIEPENGEIGVFCHEFGHVLGLPDLYDTDYSSAGAGDYTLMANGSWGGGGALPTHLDAWSRYQLGWASVTAPISSQTNLAITQIEGSPLGTVPGTLLKLWGGPASKEYFLVENRQQVGFDASLPANGLLIWHIDEAMTDNDTEWYPSLNAVLGHYMVALEQADGLWQLENMSHHGYSTGDAGDSWKSSINGFSDTSTPNSNTYTGASSTVSVRNISASSTTMTADIGLVDLAPGAARSVAAADTRGDSGGSITVTWGLSLDDGRGFGDVSGYDVMRAETAEGPFTKLGSVTKGTTLYTDATTTDYVNYYYQIVTRDASNAVASAVAGPAASRDDVAPDAVTLTGGDTAGDLGGSISLSWNSYPAPSDFKEYRIYRSDSAFTDVSSMTPLQVIKNSGTKSYQDKTTVDNHDYYYAVTCADNSQPSNELKTVTAGGPWRSNPNYSFLLPSGLSMMSLGLTLTDTDPGANLDLTHGAVLSRWDPALVNSGTDVVGGYHQYLTSVSDSFMALTPGRGYWLRTTQPMTLSLSGAAATTNTRIAFDAGWNQLGNPYMDDVDVTSATVVIAGTSYSLDQSNDRGWTRNYMWGYDTARRSYRLISAELPFSTPTIGKGQGFFFLGERSGQLVLSNPALSTSAVAAKPQPLAVDWSLRLTAETAGAADTDNFLGVCSQPERANGVVSPPATVDGLDLSFVNAGSRTATAFVKSLGTSQQWQAEVTCTRPAAQIKLNWPDLSALPRDCRPVLRDLATGTSVYMRTSNGYSFAMNRGETSRRFVVDISPKAGDLLAIRSLQTGSGSGRAQILYALSAPATVDIEIFNLAGRAVRQLQSGTVCSGACTAVWDGCADSGSNAPAGTYLVRLTARGDEGQCVNAVQAVTLRR